MSSNHKIVLDRIEKKILKSSRLALEETMIDALNFQRGFDGGSTYNVSKVQNRNYYKKTSGTRKTHPGGWSDRTGNLINSITQRKARVRGSNLVASLFTNQNYAKHLDGKNKATIGKYYVLTGLEKDFDFDGVFDKNLAGQLSTWL